MPKEQSKMILNSEPIYVSGQTLKKAVYERVHRLENLRADLSEEIAAQLLDAVSVDLLAEDSESEIKKVVSSVASLLVVLAGEPDNLSAAARRINVTIQRAAEVDEEHRQLLLFLRSIVETANYELSWKEADRYGL